MCRGDLDSFVESGYEIAVATFGDLVSHVSLRPDERVASPFDSAQGEVGEDSRLRLMEAATTATTRKERSRSSALYYRVL